MPILTVRNTKGETVLTKSFTDRARFYDLALGSDVLEGITADCGGKGKCGKCLVKFDGEALPPDENEKKYIKKGHRLACRLVLTGDGTVTLCGDGADIALSGGVSVKELSPLMKGIGFACDLGTTTVAVSLYDLENGKLLAESGRMNGQRLFGADVITRITASLAGKTEELSALASKTVYECLSDSCEKAKIDLSEVTVGTVVGNTAMCSLLCGVDVSPLSKAPFEAEELFGGYFEIPQLKKYTDAKIWVAPAVSAFVGSDVTAAALAVGINERPSPFFLADIGTNGEIMAADGGKIFAASASAGPAFEGYGISMGMTAKDGAVCRADVSDGKITVKTVGDKEPVGFCGTGVIEMTAALVRTGAVDKTGYMENDCKIGEAVFTASDIRAVQLAKGAIRGATAAVLKKADIIDTDIKTVAIAGGFGKELDFKKVSEIGLFSKAISEKAVSVGNAALSGASMMLLSSKARAEAEEISKKTVTVNLAGDPVFEDEYVEGMMF